VAASDERLSARDLEGAPATESTTPVADSEWPTAAPHDVIAMGVGAVMALHSVHEAKARVALARVATRHHVPVSAVAQAVLRRVAGTDERKGDAADRAADRAAAQLLVRGFTRSM